MRHTRVGSFMCSEYVLGGAQLGMAYGVSNRTGRPGIEEARRMFAEALVGGVTAVDTAAAYGGSEETVGAVLAEAGEAGAGFFVVTKLDPMAGIAASDGRGMAEATRASVRRSLQRLRRSELQLLLLHRSEHLFACGGVVPGVLAELRAEGCVLGMGVSVYGVDEARRCLDAGSVSAIQIPFNILDSRAWSSGLLEECAAGGVSVFARSVFLQGVLAGESFPAGRCPEGLRPPFERLRALAAARGVSLAEMALGFARAFRGVCGFVVGAETTAQVVENVRLFGRQAMELREAEALAGELGGLPDALLSPAQWNGVA